MNVGHQEQGSGLILKSSLYDRHIFRSRGLGTCIPSPLFVYVHIFHVYNLAKISGPKSAAVASGL